MFGKAVPKQVREAVQRQQTARSSGGPTPPWGRGNKVMGGLGVGPTGKPQPSMMEQQFSVSSSRGRRSDSTRLLNNPERKKPETQNLTVRLLLSVNSSSPESVQMLEKIKANCQRPDPRLFDWAVEVVDHRSSGQSQENSKIWTHLRGMREFQAPLQNSCVLFDKSKKVAYSNPNAILGSISARTDAMISALIDWKLQANQAPPPQSNGFNTSTATGASAIHQRRGKVVIDDAEQQKKTINNFARRTVLHGVKPEDLGDIAKREAKNIRREGGSRSTSSVTVNESLSSDTFGAQEMGLGTSLGPDGNGGTLFQSLGSGYDAAEKVYGSGSLPSGDGGWQISVTK